MGLTTKEIDSIVLDLLPMKDQIVFTHINNMQIEDKDKWAVHNAFLLARDQQFIDNKHNSKAINRKKPALQLTMNEYQNLNQYSIVHILMIICLFLSIFYYIIALSVLVPVLPHAIDVPGTQATIVFSSFSLFFNMLCIILFFMRRPLFVLSYIIFAVFAIISQVGLVIDKNYGTLALAIFVYFLYILYLLQSEKTIIIFKLLRVTIVPNHSK